MAYRTNQGTSLQERFRQMSEQERLIEMKKREIEQKMLQQKMKQQEETLTKMQHNKPKPKEQPKFGGNRM